MSTFSDDQTGSDSGNESSRDADRAILDDITSSLRATRPWTRFLSILGFVGVAVTLLAGIAMIVGRNFFQTPQNGPPLALTGAVNILAAGLYLVPSLWLYRASSATKRFLDGGGAIELAKVLAYQKSFWKFLGITALVALIIAAVGIVAAILIPQIISFLS
jgi:hypothetical protein